MDYFQLNGVDMRVSRLSLGTWNFSGAKIWGAQEEEASVRTIDLAIDLGINLFDTAARYGDGKSEEILGRAVKPQRDRIYLASKVHTALLGHDSVIAECEKSLKRLGTDYLDIYQIHWPSKTIPHDETLAAFEKLKRDGKIRAVGVCNHGPRCLDSLKGHMVLTNQLPYSLLWRQIEDGIVDKSMAQGLAIWAYCPLAQGLLSGKFRTIDDVPPGRRETRFYSSKWKQGRHGGAGFEQEIFEFLPRLQALADASGFSMLAISLGFLKTRKGMGSVLLGARDENQLRQNLEAFETQVPEEVIAKATALSDELKPKMGSNPDLWEDADGGRMY
jgi:aryl-alcohol dehydrogenase-like predicted oxidoreductase